MFIHYRAYSVNRSNLLRLQSANQFRVIKHGSKLLLLLFSCLLIIKRINLYNKKKKKKGKFRVQVVTNYLRRVHLFSFFIYIFPNFLLKARKKEGKRWNK